MATIKQALQILSFHAVCLASCLKFSVLAFTVQQTLLYSSHYSIAIYTAVTLLVALAAVKQQTI